MIRHCISCIAIIAGAALTVLSSLSPSVAAPPRYLSPVQTKPVQRVNSPVQSIQGGECCGQDDCCDECGGRMGCGRGNNRNRNGVQAGNFSCGCNGSFKFPVPPLSTYHWPGMYSIPLMTDYQSPWRFPPLKPYTEEPSYNGDARTATSRRFESVSYEARQSSVRTDGIEPMSVKIQRLYGEK